MTRHWSCLQFELAFLHNNWIKFLDHLLKICEGWRKTDHGSRSIKDKLVNRENNYFHLPPKCQGGINLVCFSVWILWCLGVISVDNVQQFGDGFCYYFTSNLDKIISLSTYLCFHPQIWPSLKSSKSPQIIHMQKLKKLHAINCATKQKKQQWPQVNYCNHIWPIHPWQQNNEYLDVWG